MPNKTADPLDVLKTAPDALRDMADKAPDRAEALHKLASAVEKLAVDPPKPRKQKDDRN